MSNATKKTDTCFLGSTPKFPTIQMQQKYVRHATQAFLLSLHQYSSVLEIFFNQFFEIGSWKENMFNQQLSHSACDRGMNQIFCWFHLSFIIDQKGRYNTSPAQEKRSEILKNRATKQSPVAFKTGAKCNQN